MLDENSLCSISSDSLCQQGQGVIKSRLDVLPLVTFFSWDLLKFTSSRAKFKMSESGYLKTLLLSFSEHV